MMPWTGIAPSLAPPIMGYLTDVKRLGKLLEVSPPAMTFSEPTSFLRFF
jgi:hypothetical protein